MVRERNRELPPPVCRWRTSAETLDVIEALERIEALLFGLDERLRRMEASGPGRSDPEAPEVPVAVRLQA